MLSNDPNPSANIAPCPTSSPQSSPEPLSPTPQLPEIPSDLYEPIITNCDARTLARCLRVCKLFHHHAVSRLYRSIAIRVDRGGIPHAVGGPRLDREIPSRFLPLLAEKHGSNDPTVPRSSVGTLSSFSPSATPDRSSSYHPERETLACHIYTYTKHLTINHHPLRDCQHHAPLIAPNLISLRVVPGGRVGGLTCYREGINSSPTSAALSECSLTVKLRPRRLIIGGGGSRQLGDQRMPIAGVWQGRAFRQPVPWIREIIILMGTGDVFNIICLLEPMCASVTDSVEKLVLVMDPNPRLWQGRCHELGLEAVPFEQDEGNKARIADFASPTAWTRALVLASRGRAQVVEIVGLETRSDVLNEGSVLRIQREIRDMLEKRLIEQSWTDAEARARVEGIVFTSAQEFQGI